MNTLLIEEDDLDEDRFLTEYVKGVIKGWAGLKYSNLGECFES